jgi:hypothetical protein
VRVGSARCGILGVQFGGNNNIAFITSILNDCYLNKSELKICTM